MKIHIKGTNKVYEVTLRASNGDQYEPDIFGDEDLLLRYPVLDQDDCQIDCQAEMFQEDFDALIEFWRRDVDDYNNGEPSCLGDPDDEDYEEKKLRNPEYLLTCERLID